MQRILPLFLIILNFLASNGSGQFLPVAKPEQVGISPERLQRVETIIYEAIGQDSLIPGAVLVVMRNGYIVHRQAYGFSMLIPEKKPMSVEAVFDLASMTKPIATATSVMILLERGRLRLLDPVAEYLPGFQSWQDSVSKKTTTIRIVHLLNHTSGLAPYARVSMLQEMYGAPNPDSLIAYIGRMERWHEPEKKFTYSCLNFITLQRIVETICEESLHDFSQKNIFIPLGMLRTGFKPQADCAATEVIDGHPLVCKVHDPLARIMMGGVSGNAGLFSTADDLTIFAQMMLNLGEFKGTRILSPLTVKTMTFVAEKFKFSERGLGWDIKSSYSSNGGDLFPYGSFGHTGYTGTSIWIDPNTQTAVIFLTNRAHPDDSNSVVRLRSLVANVVAASILDLN